MAFANEIALQDLDALMWRITAASSAWLKKEDAKQLWMGLKAARSRLFSNDPRAAQGGGGIRLGELAAMFGGVQTREIPREQYLRERAERSADPKRLGSQTER